MAGPNPVVVEFIAKGLDEIQKAMKSVGDAVAGAEKAASASRKRGLSEEARIAKEKGEAQARALIKTGELEKAAALAGTKFVQQQLNIRLKHMIAHSVAMYEIAQSERKKKQALLAQEDKDLASWQKSAISRAKEAEAAKTAAAVAEEKKRKSLLDGLSKVQSTHHLKKQDEDKKTAAKAAVDAEKRKQDSLAVLVEQGQKRLADAKGSAGKAVKEQAKDDKSYRKQISDAEKAEKAKQQAITDKTLEGERKRQDLLDGLAAIRAAHEKKQAESAAEAVEKAKEDAMKRRQAFSKTVMGAGGKALQTTSSIVGAAARGMLNVGGGFSLEDSVQREVAFRGRAADIAATTNTGISQGELMTRARELGISQGMDPEDVLRGYEQVKKLNDDALPQALRVMPDITKIAAVTGTDMGDMGMLAANITAANPKISDKALKSQLRIFARQGIEGGVEVSDFARYGSRITAGASLFSGNQESNEASLGMAAQIARQRGGAATAAEATLAAQRFGTDLQKKSGHLKSLGIDVEGGDGKLRNVEDVIVDMLKKENSVTGISEFKIGERGNRVLTGFADVYREAGGGAAGEKAVRDRFAAGRKDISEGQIEERFKKRMAETDKQLNIAMIKLRTEVGTKLVPILTERFIPALVQAMPAIEKLLTGFAAVADVLAGNPLLGVGLIFSGAVTKEIAAAGLQAALEKALVTPIGAAAGQAAVAMAGAAVAITAAVALIEKLSGEENARQNKSVNTTLNAANNADLLRAGGIQTPEDLARAKGVAADLRKNIADTQASKGGSTLYRGLAGAGAAVADTFTLGAAGATKKVQESGAELKAIDERTIAQQKETLDRFLKAIDAASSKLEKTGPAGPANPGAGSRNGPIGRRPGG